MPHMCKFMTGGGLRIVLHEHALVHSTRVMNRCRTVLQDFNMSCDEVCCHSYHVH